MLPYCFLVGIPLLFSLLYDLRNDVIKKQKLNYEKRNYNILIFFLFLFILLSLRSGSTGIDVPVYKSYYEYYGQFGWKKIFNEINDELGFFLLNKSVNVLSGGNFQIMLCIVAGICCALIGALYYKESENGVITILLFLTATSIFDMLFSGLRQSIAIALAVPAFYCTKKKKLHWFLLSVFVAVLFHQSAWIILILYPIYHIKLRPIHAITLVAPLTILTYIFRQQIFRILLPIAGEEYIEKYGNGAASGAVTMVILLALFVVFSFIVPDEQNMDSETNGLRNILSLSLILQMFASVNDVAMRFNYYFLLFLPLTIPKIINRWRGGDKNSKQITNIVLIVFFTVYYFYRAFSDIDSLRIYPYEFFWN